MPVLPSPAEWFLGLAERCERLAFTAALEGNAAAEAHFQAQQERWLTRAIEVEAGGCNSVLGEHQPKSQTVQFAKSGTSPLSPNQEPCP